MCLHSVLLLSESFTQVWLSKVFGYGVTSPGGMPAKSLVLPTKDYPRHFNVTTSLCSSAILKVVQGLGTKSSGFNASNIRFAVNASGPVMPEVTLVPSKNDMRVSMSNLDGQGYSRVGTENLLSTGTFRLRYSVNDTDCSQEQQLVNTCAQGYKALGDSCVDPAEASQCGNITITQGAGEGSAQAEISIRVKNAVEAPEIVLFPVNSTK